MKLCLPVLCIAACVAAACGNGSTRPFLSNTTPETHARFFAIATGPHKQDCNLCHGTSDSFRKFDCLGCHAHEQTPTTRVHVAVSGPGRAMVWRRHEIFGPRDTVRSRAASAALTLLEETLDARR